MTDSVSDQIRQELEGLSQTQIQDLLVQHLQKLQARKASYNTPEAKARRKKYYEDRKNTPEWKASRKLQAEARKAKIDALIAIAKEKGIDIASLGF